MSRPEHESPQALEVLVAAPGPADSTPCEVGTGAPWKIHESMGQNGVMMVMENSDITTEIRSYWNMLGPIFEYFPFKAFLVT